MNNIHIPVLKKEVIAYLNPQSNENFIDCTLGQGGHTLQILEINGPKGEVLGIDQDAGSIKNFADTLPIGLKKRIILVNDNFSNLKEIVLKNNFRKVSGILFDLGWSSLQLEKGGRGFSFQKNEPLDMRYDLNGQMTAEKLVNYSSVSEIERILTEYGEERFAKDIAKGIIEARKFRAISSTFQLADIIRKSTPAWYQHQKISFATKTFQALRIAVNDELEILAKALPQAVEVLGLGGRLAIISFHSLEDRIVKNYFKEQSKVNLIKILTKKPVVPQEEEIRKNPRSRSAKLRVAIKV